MPDAPDRLRPFFIVGTERSGSNLLRLLLNTHPRLFVPHPPHVMRLMRPLEPAYRGRFPELAADVSGLIARHTFPWPAPPSATALEAAARTRDLLGLYAAAHEIAREAAGKARWGCKSTFMIHEADAVLAAYPAARFLFLVRDPRDVAVSARRSVFNDFHPWRVARRWRDEQREGLDLLRRRGPEPVLLLHYERLIAEPEAEVRRVCAFLDEPFAPEMMAWFATEEARMSASLCRDWRNTDAPVLRDNAGRYRAALTRAEVAMVEAVAAAEMAALGYPLATSEAERLPYRCPGPLLRARFALLDFFWRLQAEWRSFRSDRNFPLRARKWFFLLELRLRARLRRGG